MNRSSLFLALALTTCVAGAHAQDTPASPLSTSSVCADAACDSNGANLPTSSPRMLVGDATRSLLQRQAEGSSASTQHHPLSGTVAQKIYERYVNSFKHPIPEHSAASVPKAGSK